MFIWLGSVSKVYCRGREEKEKKKKRINLAIFPI
jgi:hypothetical protein